MRKKGQNSFCDCVDEYNFNEYVSNSMSAHTAHDSVMDPLNRMHSLMKSNHTWKERAREITTTTSPNEWKFFRRRQGFSRVHFFVLFWHLFAIPFYVHYIYIAIERRMRERENESLKRTKNKLVNTLNMIWAIIFVALQIIIFVPHVYMVFL